MSVAFSKLPTMPCMARGIKVVYLANKIKPMHWLQDMNTITPNVKCHWWIYWTNGPDGRRFLTMMTNYVKLFVFIKKIIYGVVWLYKCCWLTPCVLWMYLYGFGCYRSPYVVIKRILLLSHEWWLMLLVV